MAKDLKIAGAILAGGRASRFANRPKGLLRLPGGDTIIARLLREMDAARLAPRIICANDEHPYSALAVPVIADLSMGKGPAGGIETALHHLRDHADAVLFLPCDMPGITAAEIGRLCHEFDRMDADIAFAQTAEDVYQPLCAIVHVTMYDKIALAVGSGHLKMMRLWEELGASPVRFDDDRRFININSPADFDSARGTIMQGRGEERPAGVVHKNKNKLSVKIHEGGNMPLSVTVPESLREDLTAFLKTESIQLAVASGIAGDIEVLSAADRQESTIDKLYKGGWVNCEVARTAAEKLSLSYRDFGKILDYLNIKVRECGLGCF
ncbi:MAG: molybdenum cofactor guanylyltransferase [Candidatus Latescibacterota bacterium]